MRGATLPVPGGLDGRGLDALFTDEFLKQNPSEIEEAGSQTVATDAPALSEAEEQLIEEKLRGLGYL